MYKNAFGLLEICHHLEMQEYKSQQAYYPEALQFWVESRTPGSIFLSPTSKIVVSNRLSG